MGRRPQRPPLAEKAVSHRFPRTCPAPSVRMGPSEQPLLPGSITVPPSNLNARIAWLALATLFWALRPGSIAATPVPQGASTPSTSASIRVISISPPIAPAAPAGSLVAPREVIITGENFQPGAAVKVGDRFSGVVSVSPTQIQATVLGEPAGIVDVIVSNPDGSTATLPKGFTFTTGPIVYGISPQTGTAAGATAVTISGGNLQPDSKILVGGQPAAIQQYFSSLLLTAQVPANAAAASANDPVSADVTITNPDGQSFTLPKAFTWTGRQATGASSQGASTPPRS